MVPAIIETDSINIVVIVETPLSKIYLHFILFFILFLEQSDQLEINLMFCLELFFLKNS